MNDIFFQCLYEVTSKEIILTKELKWTFAWQKYLEYKKLKRVEIFKKCPFHILILLENLNI